MAGINKVILVGNLGKDPEVRRTQDGKAVATLSLATSETWRDKNTGERKEKTEWHRVVLWEKLAEIAEQYLKKGSKVYLEGALRTRKYEKDGIEHYTTEVILSGFGAKLVMLDGRPQGGDEHHDQTERPARNSYAEGHGRAQPAGRNADMDDDIPF